MKNKPYHTWPQPALVAECIELQKQIRELKAALQSEKRKRK